MDLEHTVLSDGVLGDDLAVLLGTFGLLIRTFLLTTVPSATTLSGTRVGAEVWSGIAASTAATASRDSRLLNRIAAL